MTIVLQQKFWDLKVEKTGFSVGLSFNRVPAHLFIPFSAITAFVEDYVRRNHKGRPIDGVKVWTEKEAY